LPLIRDHATLPRMGPPARPDTATLAEFAWILVEGGLSDRRRPRVRSAGRCGAAPCRR
jgi:hypothetical protein